jgi:hypothetical protein
MKPSPVLLTESADEFSRHHDTLKDQLKPRGSLEEFFVEEIVALIWEIRRYRRNKTAVINSAFREALQKLLEQVCREPGQSVFDIEKDVKELSHQWFGGDQSAKQLVSEKLGYFGLDEHAIEAEAMTIVARDLEKFDQLLARLEWRLDKAMRSLAELRGELGRHLRGTIERVIEGEVLTLDNVAKKPPPAAA